MNNPSQRLLMLLKKTLSIFIGLIVISTVMASTHRVVDVQECQADTATANNNSSFSASSIIDSVIKYGKSFLYTPYHFGSSNGLSFDCSGFTSYIYNSFGYKLDHSSSGQAHQFPAVDRKQLKVGDLVYFSGHRRSKSHIGHVGMVVTAKEDGSFEFIHAATSRGITISSSEEPYYAQRYIMANRVVGNNPLIDGAAFYKSEQLSSQFTQVPFVEPMKQVSQKKQAQYHKVRKGESLYSIAKLYGVKADKLMALNHLKSKKLTRGKQLKIAEEESVLVSEPIKKEPALLVKQEEKKPESNTSALKSENNPEIPTSHYVKKGETLFSIAKMYNIPLDQLQAANSKSPILYAGQTLSLKVAPVSAPTKAPTSPSKQVVASSIHAVKWGETLFSIASLYDLTVEELREINHLDGNVIKEGQTLRVISANVVDGSAVAEHKHQNRIADSAKEIQHKVVKGETFFSIAKQYGCTADQLMEWNHQSADKLYVGAKLRIFKELN